VDSKVPTPAHLAAPAEVSRLSIIIIIIIIILSHQPTAAFPRDTLRPLLNSASLYLSAQAVLAYALLLNILL
jgi:hypothetical protein